MNDAELTQLLQLEAAATPGPWRTEQRSDRGRAPLWASESEPVMLYRNSPFIAAMRNHIGALLKEVLALRTENRQLRQRTEAAEARARHLKRPDKVETRTLHRKMRNALEFYADPENYDAIMFVFDAPCGEFKDDFDQDHGHEFYDRPMPGKRARAVLVESLNHKRRKIKA